MLDQIVGRTVGRISIDYRLTLSLPPEDPAAPQPEAMHLAIGATFRFVTSRGAMHHLDPEATRSALGPVLDLVAQTVERASASEDGELSVGFSDGSSLTVDPDPSYEAWQLDGPDGGYLVCLPGGTLHERRSPEERHRAELERLANDHVDPQSKVWVTHFFSHIGSSEAARAKFREALKEAAFGVSTDKVSEFGVSWDEAEVGSTEEVEGDGFWHHWTFTALPASPDVLSDAHRRAWSLADSHGVRYDGWEVQRQPLDGPPRLATEG
jgi:hypothetical protein